MITFRKTSLLSMISAIAFAYAATPASAQQPREETFVDLGRWIIVADEAARACELRLNNDPRYVLRYRLSDGRAGMMALQRRSGRFFTGIVGDVEWAFDSARFAGYQANNGYSLPAGARDVEAGFRSAKTLRVTHGGQSVAQIDLKTSSAGFRLLKQCSEQWRYIPWYQRYASANYRELEAPTRRAIPPAPARSEPIVRESAVAPPLNQPTLADPIEPRPINQASWISSDDALPWPSRGFRSGQGVLRYTLLVDEEGRAQDCEVERSTGSRRFDKQACRLLENRARFVPAKGADGNAVEGRYSASVRFAGE